MAWTLRRPRCRWLQVGVSHPGHRAGEDCGGGVNRQAPLLPRREAADDIRRSHEAEILKRCCGEARGVPVRAHEHDPLVEAIDVRVAVLGIRVGVEPPLEHRPRNVQESRGSRRTGRARRATVYRSTAPRSAAPRALARARDARAARGPRRGGQRSSFGPSHSLPGECGRPAYGVHDVAATQSPLPAVSAATTAIASPAPKASATAPLTRVPATKPMSRQKR